jgi:hypothetical protein
MIWSEAGLAQDRFQKKKRVHINAAVNFRVP